MKLAHIIDINKMFKIHERQRNRWWAELVRALSNIGGRRIGGQRADWTCYRCQVKFCHPLWNGPCEILSPFYMYKLLNFETRRTTGADGLLPVNDGGHSKPHSVYHRKRILRHARWVFVVCYGLLQHLAVFFYTNKLVLVEIAAFVVFGIRIL